MLPNFDVKSIFFSQFCQGSKIALVRSYLRVPRAAGQVKILIFLVKIKFSPYMPIIFLMQGKCLFSDISRPVWPGAFSQIPGKGPESPQVKINKHF